GRVFVRVDGPLNYASWIEGYRRGRSFATNGPMLQFAVNGVEAGSEIQVAGPTRVSVTGRADSLQPMSSIEVIVNGNVVRTIEPGGDPHAIPISEQIEMTDSGWVALRVRGPGNRWVTND